MQARLVGALRGMRWLGEGWRLFRAAPLGWIALVFAYWLLMTLVSLVPYAGVVAAAVLVPPFSVGFMAAARAASRRAPLELRLLFDGFRQQRNAQLILGVVYLVCLALVLGVTSFVDDGALARWMVTGQRPSDESLQSNDFLYALGCAMLAYLPVMMMFWFAPPLAAWHATGAAKALFFSFFACLMNWRAFIGYGAMTALVALALPFLLLSAIALAFGAALKIPITSFLFPLIIVLLPTLFASFYASYRDVFGTPE